MINVKNGREPGHGRSHGMTAAVRMTQQRDLSNGVYGRSSVTWPLHFQAALIHRARRTYVQTRPTNFFFVPYDVGRLHVRACMRMYGQHHMPAILPIGGHEKDAIPRTYMCIHKKFRIDYRQGLKSVPCMLFCVCSSSAERLLQRWRYLPACRRYRHYADAQDVC